MLDEKSKEMIREIARKRAEMDLGPVDEQELREHYRNTAEMQTGETPVKTSSYDFPEEPEPTLDEIKAKIASMGSGADVTRMPASEPKVGEVPEIDEDELKRMALERILGANNG